LIFTSSTNESDITVSTLETAEPNLVGNIRPLKVQYTAYISDEDAWMAIFSWLAHAAGSMVKVYVPAAVISKIVKPSSTLTNLTPLRVGDVGLTTEFRAAVGRYTVAVVFAGTPVVTVVSSSEYRHSLTILPCTET